LLFYLHKACFKENKMTKTCTCKVLKAFDCIYPQNGSSNNPAGPTIKSLDQLIRALFFYLHNACFKENKMTKNCTCKVLKAFDCIYPQNGSSNNPAGPTIKSLDQLIRDLLF
jgi:hypothetical protein